MYIKTNLGQIFWLASVEVLIYEYQGFKDDSLFNRKLLTLRLVRQEKMSKDRNKVN